MAARPKAWICGRSLAGIVGLNSAGGMVACFLCLLCVLRFSAVGQSLVQRSRTECGVPECDREASVLNRSWPTTLWTVAPRGGEQ